MCCPEFYIYSALPAKTPVRFKGLSSPRAAVCKRISRPRGGPLTAITEFIAEARNATVHDCICNNSKVRIN